MDEIGIKSGNTFVNIFKMIFLLLILIIIHSVLYPMISKWRNWNSESKFKIIGDKLYKLLTFAIYVRIQMQIILWIDKYYKMNIIFSIIK